MSGRNLRNLPNLIDLLFPRRCSGCRDFLKGRSDFCASCEAAWPHLPESRCTICARPFEAASSGPHLCGDCLLNDRERTPVRALGVYRGLLHDLILRMKYHGDVKAAHRIGLRMGDRLLKTPFGDSRPDLVVPVPLHRSRLRARGYNQSALLARGVASVAGIPADPWLLVKTRDTEPQASLHGDARRRNLAGAFSCRDARRRALVEGLRVILIDDVYTTGTTIEAAAAVLKKAGAASVSAMVAARAH